MCWGNADVPPILEWKQGQSVPVFRISLRTGKGSNAAQFAQDGKNALVVPVFYEFLQIGRDRGGVVHQIQMVVKDMEPVPDQFYRPGAFFDEDMSGRDLLAMRDAGIFRRDGEMAEDVPLGPFVFRLSIVKCQHAIVVPVQNVHIFPEAFHACRIDVVAGIQIQETVPILHFLQGVADDPRFPGPVAESLAGGSQVFAHAAGEFREKVVFRERRGFIEKLQGLRLPAQTVQGVRHAGVCE